MDGVPEYNISSAIFVTKTVEKIAYTDIVILEFIHPLTNQTIQVPLDGGDEYVNPETGEFFIIFVDNLGRTLLIFKGIDHSITEEYPDGNSGEDTWKIVNENTNIIRLTKWGSTVIDGVPKYDISEGTIVNETERKTQLNGTEVLVFVHPFTKEKVQVPFNGADEFVKRKTGEVFIVFIDDLERTLLIFKGIDHSIAEKYPDRNSDEDTWNINVNKNTNIVRLTKWGSIVVEGVPKYNISGATIIKETERKTDSNGIEVLEFVHPFTKDKVQVPLNGGDEFVKRTTREVFIIFVDTERRTILIFKGIDRSFTEKYADRSSGDNIWNIKVNNNTNIVRLTKWGSIAVGGVPQYNISEGTLVKETKRKTDLNGTEVLEFVHPFTNETIQLPFEGGDEFVKRKTREVFIIFIDNLGRTLLIYKGVDHSILEKHLDRNSSEDAWKINVNENTNIVDLTKWGSIVVEGLPEYNISEATIVKETERKIDSNGTEVLEFVHPLTKNIVQVPFNGGDEFVKRKTREVFIIFVDTERKTILIFKGIDYSLPLPGRMANDIDSTKTIDEKSTMKVNIVKDEWGSLVVDGVPKYNIDNATIVADTKKIIVDGISVLEFVHPITGEKIRVPLRGGDEYVNQKTQQIFVIFVDIRGQTLLILKNKQSVDSTEDWDANEKFIAESNSGSIVVKGIPKYDISTALIITKTAKKIGFNGTTVLEFIHPITREKNQVQFDGGDEYVNPKTKQIFIIFVDAQHRTLLILKDMSDLDNSESKENNNKIEDNDEELWGTMVVGGNPEYDIAKATIVKKSRKKIKNGVLVIEFTHPITLQVIDVPYSGGDEYVDPKTKKIFVIFVDILDRTILISKPSDSSVESSEDSNTEEDRRAHTDRGSIVTNGIPEYDIASAVIVEKTKQRIKNGLLDVEFEHPVSRQVIRVTAKNADEYVDPKTQRVFMIFVDGQGQTILILKRSSKKQTNDIDVDFGEKSSENDDSNENVNKNENLTDERKWGSVVANGVPKYRISKAITVMDVKKKLGVDGISILEFEHPITRQKIRVRADRGDEYVNPKTREVFLICVDLRGRTLLIFKGLDSLVSANEISAKNFGDESNDEFDVDLDIQSNLNQNIITPGMNLSEDSEDSEDDD